MLHISEYGIKIKNIEASTLIEYNSGVRKHYEYKDAMFVNSLFCDYLKTHGLKIWKEESTRDIICLEFNYGTRSFEDEIQHLHKVAKQARLEYKLAKSSGSKVMISKKKNKRQKIARLFCEAENNKEKYSKRNKEEVRKLLYDEGVNVEYISRKKNGDIVKREVIHYKMLYRSTGKAKKGSCMFICDRLYKRAKDFLYMGIKLSKTNAPIVEVGAYAPLVSSGIVGRIKINPRNILILKDVDRYFNTNVISIETDENKHCIAKHIDGYDLKNTLFDGQALIDSSIFPEWGNGYILLRHHFCKMAAFSSNIQQFFKDYFGDDYYSATVQDMFGNMHYVKDIELITTDNAMKWLKLNVSYDDWCNRVYDNDCMFGIVKTAHRSKLGDVQKMSYQMVNSLDENIMPSVVEESVSYISLLKQDDETFLDYLYKNRNFSNDYEVLIALCRQNPDFIRSSYFRERKKAIIKSYVFKMKSGKLIQNADNLVIVGSPYAMLLYAATGDENSVDDDDTFFCEEGTIQCYTERYSSGEYLAGFRSPFNSKNNMDYLHNAYCKNLDEYFNFGNCVIAVNMIGTDFQDKNNGSDQDSDSLYVTNQSDIVEYARKCYLNYPTTVNNIPKEKTVYNNTMTDFAKVDNALANSQRDIGESSNLAQIAQTYACNFEDSKYDDYTCILSVLAQVSIDSAKRRFDINVADEIRRIKQDMNIKQNGYPSFWRIIKRGFNSDSINNNLHCPMNYLYNLELYKFRNNSPTLPMSVFFVKHDIKPNYITCKKVEKLITTYSLKLLNANINDETEESYFLLRSDFDDLINTLQRMNISNKYVGLFSWLLNRAFMISDSVNNNSSKIESSLQKNKAILVKTLYEANRGALLQCFKKA